MRFDSLASWIRGEPDADPVLRRVLDGAVPFALPLARRFRGTVRREGVLLAGPSGWGEFAPFDDYDDAGAARWLASAVEAAYGTWPAPVRAAVPVNAIVPAVPPEDAAALTRAAVLDHGCTTVKVKVAEAGQTEADDLDRVAAVRDALDAHAPGRGRIRVDANGGWDVGAAARVLARMAADGLEYAEQPCATLDELAALRRAVDVPVAADEGLRRAADPADPALAARLREAADVVVIKVPPLGGVAAALRVAEAVGLPVVVSGALDSAVGLSAGLAAAAALPGLPMACGLGTGALLAADVVAAPRVPRGGALEVGRVAPDRDALLAARGRLADSRSRWWRHRLAAAWAAGARDAVGHLVAGA